MQKFIDLLNRLPKTVECSFERKVLKFRHLAATSRGVLSEHTVWYISILDRQTGVVGVGEIAPLEGLSRELTEAYSKAYMFDLFEGKIKTVIEEFNVHLWDWVDGLTAHFPSIRFGFEQAILDFLNGGKQIYFQSPFVDNKNFIPINGLVWMGEKRVMKHDIIEKIKQNYRCIKLKIGAIDFDDELDLIRFVRQEFSVHDVEIRVDANGAFEPKTALEKLKRLSDFGLHSIEQPIAANQLGQMARLCAVSPLAIALDEELIAPKLEAKDLLETIRPQYIVLKPTLLGGFYQSQAWIEAANGSAVKWWITSALESNIGLNALAQWTYKTINSPNNLKFQPLLNEFWQGLGTGNLYENNTLSRLTIADGNLFYG